MYFQPIMIFPGKILCFDFGLKGTPYLRTCPIDMDYLKIHVEQITHLLSDKRRTKMRWLGWLISAEKMLQLLFSFAQICLPSPYMKIQLLVPKCSLHWKPDSQNDYDRGKLLNLAHPIWYAIQANIGLEAMSLHTLFGVAFVPCPQV